MMEVYRTPSKETQEILLASAIYAEVIEGLNGYFTSEPRNEYITIHRRIDSRTFYLYDPEAWADILIAWLRTKHEIFYYPDMEAKYAKMEKIPPFTERMMDEGAYNSLKALHKHVTGKETSTNSHALIADDIKYFVNEEESAIENLKKRIAELESNFKAVCDESDLFKTRALKAEEEVRKLKVELNAIKDTVSQARSRLNSKFVPLPGYECDLVKLADIALKAVEARDETINRMSLIEDGCKRCQRNHSTDKFNYIRRTNKAEEELKELKEQLDKATADYQALSEENQKLKKEVEDTQEAVCKDIMGYIRYEASRNGFELPEGIDGEPLTVKRVFHDLFDLMRKRGEEIRILKTEDLLHKSVDSVNKECKVFGEQMVEGYKFKIKSYILKDIKEHGYRYDGLETKSIEEIVDRIITMAFSDHSFMVLKDIYTAVASPVERLRYNDCDGPTVSHMKDYILRRFEGLSANTEYCLKKMSELDGCQKDLKILEEQQEFLVKQNSELATKVSAKDDEISRLKDLINAMNKEVGDM